MKNKKLLIGLASGLILTAIIAGLASNSNLFQGSSLEGASIEGANLEGGMTPANQSMKEQILEQATVEKASEAIAQEKTTDNKTTELPVGTIIKKTDTGEPATVEKISAQTNACTTGEGDTFYALIVSLDKAIKNLNATGVNLDNSSETNGKLNLIIEGLLKIDPASGTNYSSTNCFKLISPDTNGLASLTVTEKEVLINGLINEYNDERLACQEELSCEAIELEEVDLNFSCNPNREYDSATKSCKNIVLECAFDDVYDLAKEANDILDDYSDSDEDDLIEILEDLADELEISTFDDYIDDFDIGDDGSDLSEDLVDLVDTIIDESDNCEDLRPLSKVVVIVPEDESPGRTPARRSPSTTENSCPANAEYDDVAEECYCDSIDEFVEEDDVCPRNASSTPRTFDDDEFDFSGLEDLEDPEDEEDFDDDAIRDGINSLLDDDFDESDLEDPEDEGDENDRDDLGDLEDPAGSTPPRAPDEAFDIPGLGSNTNANILGAGVMQGETGPAMMLSLLASGFGTMLYGAFRKK